MRLLTVSLISLGISFLLCWSCLITAKQIAKGLVKENTMKHINEELEGNTPTWDSNLGRWIEPDEVLDTGAESRDEPMPTDGASSWYRTYQRGLKQHIAYTNATIKTP